MQMNNNNKNNARVYRTPWSIPSQPKKKVVSIPVHFVDSESERVRKNNNNSAAMKIQKVVRGFLVRNSMRRIKAIRVELEKIESKVCDPETKEMIKRVQKERLKVSEGIMSMLLKLDSVRVLDYYSGVRDYRKSVIKKAIALQEMVDQIQVVDPTHQDQFQLTDVYDTARGSHLVGYGEGADVKGKKMAGEKMEVEEKKEDGEDEGADAGCLGVQGSHLMGSGEGADVEGKKMVRDEEEEGKKEDGEVEGADAGRLSERGSHLVESEEDANVEGKEIEGLRGGEEEKMEVEEKEKEDGDGDGVGEESVGTCMVEEVEENCVVKEEEGEEEEGCKDGRGGGGEEGDYENKNKELLERMMEDNERMMGMMAQLFEKNEMQTRLLSSLSNRVEQLERAYACDKLRKKKRRNADAKHKQTH